MGGPLWIALLALACSASVITIVVLGTRLTFFNDDWYFLLHRPGWSADTLLAPSNGHLSVLDVILYKALTAGFGLGHQWPFRLVLGLSMASLGVAVYVWIAGRVGPLPALAATVLVLFLGTAWEDLLFFASISLVAALATGLGALCALDRPGTGRALTACVLLTCSIGFSDLGVVFVAAAAVMLLIDRRPEAWWTVAVPAALFVVWWASYGHDDPSHVTRANLEHLPRYVLDSASIGLATLTGLNRGSAGASFARGRVVLLLAILLIVVWLLRGGRPSLRVLVPVVALAGFWLLAGAGFQTGRGPEASRYQLIDAVLILAVAAELLRAVRPPRAAVAAVGALGVASLASNADIISYGYSVMRTHSDYARADVGALMIARGHVDPRFSLTPAVAGDAFLSGVTAGPLFVESDAHGAPDAASARELVRGSVAQRRAADRVLVRAESVALRPVGGGRSAGGCRSPRRVRPGRPAAVAPRPAVLGNAGRTPLVVTVRRFGDAQAAIPVGVLAPGATARLSTPSDRAPQVPWRLGLLGRGSALLCGA
jgi:hypothetical protein